MSIVNLMLVKCELLYYNISGMRFAQIDIIHNYRKYCYSYRNHMFVILIIYLTYM